MKMMLRGRRGGKTYELLRIMHDNPTSVMVCFSAASAKYTKEEAQQLYPGDDWDRRFIPVESARERLAGRPVHGSLVLVDNAEMVLANMLGREPFMATATAEPV